MSQPAVVILVFSVFLVAISGGVCAQNEAQPGDGTAKIDFKSQIQPILQRYCFKCHGEKRQKGDLRLDTLDPRMTTPEAVETWTLAQELVNDGEMPPGRSKKPTKAERDLLVAWVSGALTEAGQSRSTATIRRLTRRQYTSALNDLLGIEMDFGRRLPPDGKSEMGFSNDGEVLRTSALHLESFQEIAREAITKAIGSEAPPKVTHYRIRFGEGVGKGQVAGKTGGYQSVPLDRDDFVVEILDAEGQPRQGEGEEKRALDAIRKKISVGFRGSSLDRFATVKEGVILYGALPHVEVAPGSWQGPSPNMKLEMQRVFPREGDFVMRVRASRGYLVKGRRKLLVPADDAGSRVGLKEADAAADQKARARLEPTRLGAWQVAGPIFERKGETARDRRYLDRSRLTFDRPFAEGKGIWRPAGEIDGKIQKYESRIGAVFLGRVIEAPSPRILDLAIGSDDAVWVWLNGEEILGADLRRGVAADQNFLALPLRAGRNDLLIKVVNFGGGFGSYVRDVHDGTLRAAAPYVLELEEGAVAIAAERSLATKNLRAEGAALVPKKVPELSRAQLGLELEGGYWQFDVVHPVASPEAMASVRMEIGKLRLDLRPQMEGPGEVAGFRVTPIGVALLEAGRHQISLGGSFFAGFGHLVASPLPAGHPLVERLEAQAEAQDALQTPELRAFIGTRTDDGMDYATFDQPRPVLAPLGESEVYQFRGRLEDLPIPEPESGDTEILSGICVLGVWNHHLVKSKGDPGPPLLIESIEFEAPYLQEWPPASYRQIFFASPNREDEEVYAREVFESFLTRAWRRPLREGEVDRFLDFWRRDRADFSRFEESVKEGLIAALCSPSFLFRVEADAPRDAEGRIDEVTLAERLAFFLWNSPPDARLRDLAARGELRASLDTELDRMLEDAKVRRFVRTFAEEWLRLDRLRDMTIDAGLFPKFTRFVKRDMEEETHAFIEHLIRQDESLLNLIDSDFALLNQNLAEFYGVEGVRGSAFRAVKLPRAQGRGGLISQGAFLAGHSDGAEPHPIKRAVWVKEKLLGRAPLPPPPNVPELDPDVPGFENMTLKEKIVLHRSRPACASCHASFDAYGIALEHYNAVGLLEVERKGRPIDAKVELPDGAEVDGAAGLKRHLLENARDEFTASLIKHLFAYALGREVHPEDGPELAAILEQVREQDYAMRSLLKALAMSPSMRDL
jgi:mono/diheme cytochrome c family protein